MREATFRRAIADRSQVPPHGRFPVYRNNVDGALINALRVRYPVTAQLAGAKAFAAMAIAYATANLPASPVLIEYGASFPHFIETHERTDAIGYLAGVARLESLWWRAYHAADEAPLDCALLGDRDFKNLRLTFHGSVSLMDSPYAVGSIWQASRTSGSLDGVDVATAEAILIARPEAEVEVRILPTATYSFLSSLNAGETVAASVDTAMRDHSDFDLPAQINALLAARVVTGFTFSGRA